MASAMMTNAAAAARYAARGLHVFPVAQGGKVPAIPGGRGCKDATTDQEAVAEFWAGNENYNIGVATGHDGLFVLDIDGSAGESSLAELIATHGALPDTVEETTGRGRHLFFKSDTPFSVPKNSAGKLGAGLDIRGEGGYVVVAPSTHPSGAIYAFVPGKGPAKMAVAEAPLWLMQLIERPAVTAALAAVVQPAVVAPLPSAMASNSLGLSVGNDRAQAYGAAALEAECRAIGAAPNGSQEKTLNDSAVKVGGLVAGGCVDHAVALAALTAAGLAMPSFDPSRPWSESTLAAKVIRGLSAGSATPRKPPEIEGGDGDDNLSGVIGTNGADFSEAWENPDLSLLGVNRRPAPRFPTELLGPFWQDWAVRNAAGASAPVDYVAAALLASVGAMIGNVRHPQAGAGWREPPALWCALVGAPSSGKSPAMEAPLALVRHIEEGLSAGFETARREYETKKQFAKASREDWEVSVKAAVKAAEPSPRLPDDAICPPEPVRPRVVVGDVTTEKLAALSAGLPRGLMMVRDELAGYLAAFDRYGGGGTDRAFALEMYGGRGFVVDRVKSPEPIHIRHLTVGLLGGVQPDKVALVTTGQDDGLPSRLLWVWPDILPEFVLSKSRLDQSSAQAAFGRLASLPMSVDEGGALHPLLIRLTPEAEDILEQFARMMAIRSNAASGLLAGALGKARGHVLRLGAILEHAWWCGVRGATEPETISAKAIGTAAELMDSYFIPMTERVLCDAAASVADRNATVLARHLKQAGESRFNARNTRHKIGGTLRDATDMAAACKALAEAGLIRPDFLRVGPGHGRAAQNYEVNPAVWGQKP